MHIFEAKRKKWKKDDFGRVFSLDGIVEVHPELFEPIGVVAEEKNTIDSKVIEKYVCPVCMKDFQYKIALAGHLRSHKGGIS